MSNVQYDQVARDFDKVRDRTPEAQQIWCEQISDYLPAGSVRKIIDVGAGTGIWAHALAKWFSATVYAVEPEDGMREHAMATRPHADIHYVKGTAGSLPLDDNTADAAWMSTVIHQFPDVNETAQELRRVLKPEAPVLIRSSFPGRQDEIELFHLFPGVLKLTETWPRLGRVITAFEDAGFRFVALERVREPTFDSYDELIELLPAIRRSDTALVDLDEGAWNNGVERIRAAHEQGQRPWDLGLDLLVMD